MSDTDDIPPSSSVPNEPELPAPIDARPNVRLLRPDQPASEPDAEKALLGSALYYEEVADVVARIDPDLFYYPQHAEIATAISVLRSHGEIVDVVSVAAELVRRNPNTTVDKIYVLQLHDRAPTKSAADTYLRILQECKQLRELQRVGADVKTAAEKRDIQAAMEAAESMREVAVSRTQSTWLTVEMGTVLEGVTPSVPTMLHRTDGMGLIYPGRVHAFNGSSESGKSWLAFWACAEEIAQGHNVLYYDFEDSAANAVNRLRLLGVSDDRIVRYFYYVRPDDSLTAEVRSIIRATLEDVRPTLCVVDGVTEAMVMNTWSINDNDDVQRFLESLPRPIAAYGAAVILIDHVVKNSETQGDHAIGAQHKKAGIDVSYSFRVLQQFAPGQSGRVLLTVWKDRPGSVRAYAADRKHPGEMVLTPRGEGLRVAIVPPNGDNKPTYLMEKASRILELEGPLTKSSWEERVKGQATSRRRAMELLIAEGYVEIRVTKRSRLHHSARTYRQPASEPTDDEDY